MVSKNIDLMIKKRDEVRLNYSDINFEDPGYADDITCESYNQTNRDLHSNCIVDALNYYFNQHSGRYAVTMTTGLGKSYSSCKAICEMIKQGKISASSVVLLGINSSFSALDDIIHDYPDLEPYAKQLFLRYYTYQALTVNASYDASGNINSIGTLDSVFANVKYVIADECHRLAAEKGKDVCLYLINKYGDSCSFLFLSTIIYRYDDSSLLTVDYIKNLFQAEVLYSLTRLDAYALGILLSPYHIKMQSTNCKRDVLLNICRVNKCKTLENKVLSMTDAEVDDNYKLISSKHIVSSYVDLADKCFPLFRKEGVLGKKKINCLVLVDTIDSINYKLTPIREFFSDIASRLGKNLVINESNYACGLSSEDSRNNLLMFDEQDKINGKPCSNSSNLYVDVLVGVHAVAQSIHPDVDILFSETSIKANVKRYQAQGRLDSFSRKRRAVIVDFFNTFDLGLRNQTIFGEGEGRATGSPYYFDSIVGEPDLLQKLAKLELCMLSSEQLASLSELITSNVFDYASNIDAICSVIGDKFGLSSSTIKIVLSDSGLVDVKFLTYEEAIKLFDSILLTSFSKKWGSYSINDDGSYYFSGSETNVNITSQSITVGNNVFEIKRAELPIFTSGILDTLSCKKCFEETISSIVALV